MFGHLVAALVAFGWSIRYQRTFDVSVGEYTRYWLKSINLALCYRGFSDNCEARSLIGAGKAAFFCCAFDVITDWRNFDPVLYKRFEFLAKQSLTAEQAELATGLYWQEKEGELKENGLSRGTTALHFVTKIMGSESAIRQKTDFNHLGIVMQIVDDVIDVEDDRRDHKTNCLFSSKRNDYLAILAEFPVGQMKTLMPNGCVLWKIVGVAQQKAQQLLRLHSHQLVSEPSVNIDCRPYHNIT